MPLPEGWLISDSWADSRQSLRSSCSPTSGHEKIALKFEFRICKTKHTHTHTHTHSVSIWIPSETPHVHFNLINFVPLLCWGVELLCHLVKSACNLGDLGLIPCFWRSPREGNGNPHQYSCLENSMDGGAWWAITMGSQRVTNNFTVISYFYIAVGKRQHQKWGLIVE